MTIEAIKAADYLRDKGISVKIIDIRTLRPLDDTLIIQSVRKTGKLLVMDSGYYSGGFAGEIIARVVEKEFAALKCPPQRITLPDHPTPSTPGLTKYYYPRMPQIVKKILEMVGRTDVELPVEDESVPLDVPDKSFTGPF